MGQSLSGGSVPPNLQSKQLANYQEMATSKLFDASGKQVEPVYAFGQDIRQNGRTVAFVEDAWFPTASHGQYQFRVSDLAGPQDLRTIDVP